MFVVALMPMPLSVLLVYSYCSILAVKLSPYPGPANHRISSHIKRESLAVGSIAPDDPSTLPGDDPFPRTHSTIISSMLAPACTANAMRGKLGSEFET